MAAPALSNVRVDFRAVERHPDGAGQVCRTAGGGIGQGSHDGSRFAHYITSLRDKFIPVVFGISLTTFVVVGWLNRNEGNLTPESGIGYWLGVIGAGLLLLLLIYPLRKRSRLVRALGNVAFWFRAHMILGLVGPALILLHSNFQLGSLNSKVALFAMLTVATSGLIGRYLYGKIHLGLYGRKAAVQQIVADADTLRDLLCDGLLISDHIIVELNSFVRIAMAPRAGVLANFWWMSVLSLRTRVARKRLLAEARQLVKREGKRLGWSRRMRRQRLAAATELMTLHLAVVKKAAAFAFYERLFSLWHVLHLPLFVLLIMAAVAHVIAVHFY